MDIFKKPYYTRLKDWSELRKNLEFSATPIQDTLRYWKDCVTVKFTVDTRDPKTWPTPWEAIKYNEYCKFLQIYMVANTLKLTPEFSHTKVQIYITQVKKSGEELYFLLVNNKVIGYTDEEFCELQELPTDVDVIDCFTIPDNN